MTLHGPLKVCCLQMFCFGLQRTFWRDTVYLYIITHLLHYIEIFSYDCNILKLILYIIHFVGKWSHANIFLTRTLVYHTRSYLRYRDIQICFIMFLLISISFLVWSIWFSSNTGWGEQHLGRPGWEHSGMSMLNSSSQNNNITIL